MTVENLADNTVRLLADKVLLCYTLQITNGLLIMLLR